MILPSKHVPAERALLTLGAQMLRELSEPLTVSTLWARVRSTDGTSYQSYTLALSFLYAISAVEMSGELIARSRS
jgi:hypothetical protein